MRITPPTQAMVNDHQSINQIELVITFHYILLSLSIHLSKSGWIAKSLFTSITTYR